MKETTSTLRFCPKCGSPSIEFKSIGIILGDQGSVPAKCCACGWAGPTSELLASPIQHDQGSDEELAEKWSAELRGLYAQFMGPGLITFLAKWGFVSAVPKGAPKAQVHAATLLFARYVAAMGAASAQAILEVRREVEAERVRGLKAAGGYDA